MTEAQKLYKEIEKLELEGEHDTALYELFKNLIDNIREENFEFCDEYIEITLQGTLQSDVLVHMLNPLSNFKEELKNWDKLVDVSTSFFIETYGEKRAADLLQVIR